MPPPPACPVTPDIGGTLEEIMEPRCVAGDLAVVIKADHPSNIGHIVRVLAPHDGKGDLVFHNAGTVWLVESFRAMTWAIGKKRIRRKRGPVPDSLLKPIRGSHIHHVEAHQHLPSSDKAAEHRQIDSLQEEPEYTGMDDPRWMAKAQQRIDEFLEQGLRERIGFVTPQKRRGPHP